MMLYDLLGDLAYFSEYLKVNKAMFAVEHVDRSRHRPT